MSLDVERVTRDQRHRLADLLESLDDDQWQAPSLCEGWSVADVAAHVTMSPRFRWGRTFVGLVRHRFDFNSYVDAEVRSWRTSERGDVLAAVRGCADVPADFRLPSFVPLLEILVHSQDIAIPLGIELPMPTEAAAAVADVARYAIFPFNGRGRARGRTLRATMSAGAGAVANCTKRRSATS